MDNYKNQVTLYIAEHNVTGKKYFGKTEKFFTVEDLQLKYHGSGTYWLNHLKKHGNDVTMSIYGIFNKCDVENIALKFSKENDIVRSNEWANIKHENGLDGQLNGMTYDEIYGPERAEHILQKMSDKFKNRIFSDEHKQKISKSRSGQKLGPMSNVHKQKISDKLKLYMMTDEHKQNISKALIGKKLSDDHKKKLSDVHKGKVPWNIGKTHSDETKKKLTIQVSCPHCGKIGARNAMLQWHFNNCKELNDEPTHQTI